GSLFGALVGRALDEWWDQLGRPDPFLVVEAGAGRGRLAREILRSEPACAAALRYVLVERSPALRAAQRELLAIEPEEDALGPFVSAPGDEVPDPIPGCGPIVTALDELPGSPFEGVVLANELLDNLPFDVVERTERGWDEIRVGLAAGELSEVSVPAADALIPAFDVPVGSRLPVQRALEEWIGQAGAVLRRGVVVVIDYAAPAAELVTRGRSGWLRTFRRHSRGHDPFDDPGGRDITADLVLETLLEAGSGARLDVTWKSTQAEWLSRLGVDEIVADARARWTERAAIGDLDALTARSTITEAAALTDPAGLGAHTVVAFTKQA
ncbi:MAG TPA: class I SAM-dependent methyltransferase, partial [Acidimicrobiia bacterium]|nr:class I SAM-dependent methyltransferase [Acidimicrobiia bacterium]